MTSRIGRWIEDTFGVEIYKWYARDEWVETDTVLVHSVTEEYDSSIDARVSFAHEYRHKESGARRRRVGIKFTDKTKFAPKEKIENNVQGVSGKKSYPEEKYLNFNTKND